MLTNGGSTKHTLHQSRHDGFLIRGQSLQTGAVVAHVPDSLEGAETSVCGVKGFLVDERRTFTNTDGVSVTIDCAKVAALDITDSPVHVHGETVETYHILSGNGQMVLGDTVVTVGPGSFIVIPPGTMHGLCSSDPATPLRVLMTFSPGLAPISHEAWRDERICASHASQRIQELTA